MNQSNMTINDKKKVFAFFETKDLPINTVKVICIIVIYQYINSRCRGHLGRARMVVGFTTTYAINAYHH